MNSSYDEAPDRRRFRWLLAVAGTLAVALVVVWWPGCRQYPPVTSKESLQLMRRLYSACNTRNQRWLAKVEQGVQKATRDGRLSAHEQQAFARIIKMARDGDWEDAERAAFRFAQDQVGVGHPSPDGDDHPRDRTVKARKGKAR